jgi:N-methylhydantoinase B/oxoprolinase/acetone carboxylase alpha subunit
LQRGEAFVNYSAGGAGWGDPAKRDPKARDNDLANGFITQNVKPAKGETP